MYKKLFICTIGLITILFTACQSPKKQVQSQAQEFLTAYYKSDYSKAKGLSTSATHQLLDEKHYFQSLNPYSQEEDYSEFKILKTVMRKDNTQARVEYSVEGKLRKLNLIKMDGKWLIDMSKEDPLENSTSFTNKQVDGGGVATAESNPIKISDVK